jgi:anthranilate synthase component 1
MLLATDLAVLDHAEGSVLLVANALLGPEPQPAVIEAAYDDALGRLDAMTTDLAKPAESTVSTLASAAPPAYVGTAPAAGYPAAVEQVKEEIRAGEAFQVVLSQRFEVATTAQALDVYRVLRASNPSPYMYLLRFTDHDVVGSSPEALVKVTAGRAMLHPIAGTRPRGATPEQDAALAADLLADPKERSVHVVSTVVGEVTADRTAYDVLTACFPAGTLSGAPKPRAMEIIEELEPTRRGLYGGAVGYLGFGGDSDTAIAIRTVVLRAGRAYVQAGAGIVADSDPATEDQECRNKAAVVLQALAAAESLRRVG